MATSIATFTNVLVAPVSTAGLQNGAAARPGELLPIDDQTTMRIECEDQSASAVSPSIVRRDKAEPMLREPAP